MAPLPLFLSLAAIASVSAQIIYKLAGELSINGGFETDKFLTVFLPILGFLLGLFPVYVFNVTMSLYENLTI